MTGWLRQLLLAIGLACLEDSSPEWGWKDRQTTLKVRRYARRWLLGQLRAGCAWSLFSLAVIAGLAMLVLVGLVIISNGGK